jgi:hypothetical protein
MPLDAFLARLDRVRKSGNGWTARCPAHDDRTASLSIADGDDGRVLVHCFAGCAVADIVAAVGLTLADLFPERVRDLSPLARAERRKAARESGWAAALRVLSRESGVVAACAHAIAEGAFIGNDDLSRLATAIDRIEQARGVLTA